MPSPSSAVGHGKLEMTIPEIATINLARRIAITEDGQQLPVTDMFDEFGDDCDDIEECVVCVAGPDSTGMWLTIDFRKMEKVAMQ